MNGHTSDLLVLVEMMLISIFHMISCGNLKETCVILEYRDLWSAGLSSVLTFTCTHCPVVDVPQVTSCYVLQVVSTPSWSKRACG